MTGTVIGGCHVRCVLQSAGRLGGRSGPAAGAVQALSAAAASAIVLAHIEIEDKSNEIPPPSG